MGGFGNLDQMRGEIQYTKKMGRARERAAKGAAWAGAAFWVAWFRWVRLIPVLLYGRGCLLACLAMGEGMVVLASESKCGQSENCGRCRAE